MTPSVLADTGPLYALADPSDQFHNRSREELEALTERRHRVLISFPVLCEAHTLVVRRLGLEYSQQWLTEVWEGGNLLNPESTDFITAVSKIQRYPDQPITLVDAVTAALSNRLAIPVWTYDRHFTTMRAKLWH